MRLGAFARRDLAAEVERFRGMRWMRTLRVVVPLADGRAESPPESILRLRWIESGLPSPIPQVVVRDADDDFLARLDLDNPEMRLAAEYDGAEWHDSPDQREHDRRRRQAVEQETDWKIVVMRKENLFGHHQDADRMLRAAARR